jgi:hypothetical protein
MIRPTSGITDSTLPILWSPPDCEQEYPHLLPRANSAAVRRKSVAALENQHTVRDECCRPGRLNPNLSWTHYRSLPHVERAEARTFYEIEAAANA